MSEKDESSTKFASGNVDEYESCNEGIITNLPKICIPLIKGKEKDGSVGDDDSSDNESYSDTPRKKKAKLPVKKCRICKTTEGVIISNACPLHLSEMRRRNAVQRNEYNKSKQGLCISYIPYNIRVSKQYRKVLAYFNDIVMPATRVQGGYIEMSKKGVYLSLKNNGVAFIKNGIPIKDMEFLRFKGMVGNKQWKWCTLMTTYTVDGGLMCGMGRERNSEGGMVDWSGWGCVGMGAGVDSCGLDW